MVVWVVGGGGCIRRASTDHTLVKFCPLLVMVLVKTSEKVKPSSYPLLLPSWSVVHATSDITSPGTNHILVCFHPIVHLLIFITSA